MKRLFLLALIILTIAACTDNMRARRWGGNETVNLPKGQRLVIATWKDNNIWYLTEPMPENYEPQTRIFKEKSSFGSLEGQIDFVESR